MPMIGLFPGQGAQCVGMLRHSLSLPSVQSLCKLASDTLGYDLSAVCKSGPQEKLNQTVYCQPATLLASLASYQMYTQSHSTLTAAAGFSLGEVSALAVSNSLSFHDAFLFVKDRAEAMQDASDRSPSAMLSVSGISVDVVRSVLEEFNGDKHTDTHGVIANYLAENAFSLSVARSDVSGITDMLGGVGASRVKIIPVSGGFHSRFMQSAGDKIREIVDKIDIQLPDVPVYSNITADAYTSVEEIRNSLTLQMTQPVQWYKIMRRLIDKYQNTEFIELGYGTQLLSLLARIDRKSYKLASYFTP